LNAASGTPSEQARRSTERLVMLQLEGGSWRQDCPALLSP